MKPPLSAAERQSRLIERDKLIRQAVALRKAGRLDDAIAAGEKVLAIDDEVLSPDSPDSDVALTFLALLHESKQDYAVLFVDGVNECSP